MRPVSGLVRAASVAAALAFAAPPAHAQTAADRATARELGMDGQAALDKKDFATAEDRFRRADALYHAPTLLLGYARAEAGLGKVVNASEAYNRIIREGAPPGAPAAFVAAVAAASAEVGAVQARIASVTIAVVGPDTPTVTLDDQPVPVAALGVKRPVDPGEHVVKATSDGWQPAETKFTVTDAGNATASLTLLKAPSPAASAAPTAPAGNTASSPATAGAAPVSSGGGSTQRTIGMVGLGAGILGLGIGAVTGIISVSKHSALAGECPGGSCTTSAAQTDLSGYHTMAGISTAGFIAGGVLAGAGLVLMLTAPRVDAPAQTGAAVHPFVGLGTVGAVGTF
jgi:hypothetical protein